MKAWLVVLAACGGAQHPTADVSWLHAATTQVQTGPISPYLSGPVKVAGIWFPDADCRARFAGTRVVFGDELTALGACLDGLHLAYDPRSPELGDSAIFQYGPGLELETRFRHDRDGAKLIWIGWVNTVDGRDARPTITATALESLRIAGDPGAGATGRLDAWFQVCIDQAGAVTDATPVAADLPAEAAALVPAIQSWKFRPFALGDQATPACSWIELTGSGPRTNAILVPPLDPSAIAMLPMRWSGETNVPPDRNAQRMISKLGLYELMPSFRICVDVDGKITKLAVYTTSGIQYLDQMYARVIATWRYARSDVPSCGLIRLDYVQNK